MALVCSPLTNRCAVDRGQWGRLIYVPESDSRNNPQVPGSSVSFSISSASVYNTLCTNTVFLSQLRQPTVNTMNIYSEKCNIYRDYVSKTAVKVQNHQKCNGTQTSVFLVVADLTHQRSVRD